MVGADKLLGSMWRPTYSVPLAPVSFVFESAFPWCSGVLCCQSMGLFDFPTWNIQLIFSYLLARWSIPFACTTNTDSPFLLIRFEIYNLSTICMRPTSTTAWLQWYRDVDVRWFWSHMSLFMRRLRTSDSNSGFSGLGWHPRVKNHTIILSSKILGWTCTTLSSQAQKCKLLKLLPYLSEYVRVKSCRNPTLILTWLPSQQFFQASETSELFLRLSCLFLCDFVSVCLQTIAPETVKGARASSASAHRRTGWSLAVNGKNVCNL